MKCSLNFEKNATKEDKERKQKFYEENAGKYFLGPSDTGKSLMIKSYYEIKLSNGTLIGVFQGSKGKVNPQLDIIIKYQEKNKDVRTPSHTHWTIDLLIKKSHDKDLTKEFIKFLLNMWDKTEPIRSKKEQMKPNIRFAVPENLSKFEELNGYGEYTVEFIATVIELLMTEEKTGLGKAFMFRGVLEAIYQDKDIFSVVSAAGYRG
jgi:hypothetical protein